MWLSQVSGEPHRLTNSGRAIMHIHLLSVSGSTCEIATKRPPIDEEIASDDTDILPLSKNIEASGLPSTRSTHESRHRPRPDVAVNLMEESKICTRDGDNIIDALPSKSLAVGERDLFVNFGSLLFDALWSLLLLEESRIELGGLFGLLCEEREADTSIRRTLETRHLSGTLTERGRLQ